MFSPAILEKYPALSPAMRPKLFAMIGLCFVLMMVALDQTVVGTALPTIVAELHGYDLYAWVGTSYLLTSVITIPIFGRLGDEYGRKPFVLAAIVLFTLASMLCGLAQTMLQLVLARGLQGIGGGMLVGTAFACVPDMFPDAHQRLRWQVMFSSAFGIANAIGPSLGGFLTTWYGWRWVFYVNLPVGMMSLWFLTRHLPLIRHSDKPPAALDWPGALLIAIGLGGLQLFVEWLPTHHSVWALSLIGTLSLAAIGLFVWQEKRTVSPLIPLSMLTSKSLRNLFILSLVMGFCLFGIMYYAPLMFQGGFGLTPDQAGLLITPLVVSITIGSIVNGRIVIHLEHPKRMLYVGIVLFAGAALCMTRMNVHMPHEVIMCIMAAAGLGLGLTLPNLTIFVQYNADKAQLGIATAMLQSLRMTGGMLGTALIGTWVNHQYAAGLSERLGKYADQPWSQGLYDPQSLIAGSQHQTVVSQLIMAGRNYLTYFEEARSSLVASVHTSQMMVAVTLVVAFVLVLLLPPIKITKDKKNAATMDEGI